MTFLASTSALISFSGLDGSGKSTQIAHFSNWLTEQKIPFKVYWSRGGYTPLFSAIKQGLRALAGRRLAKAGHSAQRDAFMTHSRWARIWLLVAILDLALYYGVYFRILTFLGYTVIADRYIWDTQLDFELNFPTIFSPQLWSWQFLCTVAPRPKVAILLDVPLSVSLSRLSSKAEPFPDSETRLEARYTGYQTFLQKGHYTAVDATAPIEAVFLSILETVQ